MEQPIAEAIVNHITNCYSKLIKLENFRPGEIVNETLSNLLSVCCQIHDTDTVKRVLGDSRVRAILPRLREICAEAECSLEAHWTEYINGSSSNAAETMSRLGSFPYYQNYKDLTRMELCALSAAGMGLPTSVAFIGSGPLPLTSLCILQHLKSSQRYWTDRGPTTSGLSTEESPDVTVLNIDRSEAAIAASAILSKNLGRFGQGMEFRCTDASALDCDLGIFDVVYLAALVGKSQSEKEDLLVNVAGRMRTGAFMVVRTSWGLRTCLYPEVDLTAEKVSLWLEVVLVVHPYSKVVNSVIVARVK